MEGVNWMREKDDVYSALSHPSVPSLSTVEDLTLTPLVIVPESLDLDEARI